MCQIIENKVAQAVIAAEEQQEDPELGPTTDKNLSRTKITFNTTSSVPKLLKVDDNCLNKQINKIKEQNVKTGHNDPSKNEVRPS